MSHVEEFPPAIDQNGRMFFVEAHIENYIRRLAGAPEVATKDVRLIPAAEAARRLGVHRRTIGRRVYESKAAAEAATSADASA